MHQLLTVRSPTRSLAVSDASSLIAGCNHNSLRGQEAVECCPTSGGVWTRADRPEQRFTRLYDAHYSTVRAYAFRRGPDSADDVVAETFTIAWQRLEQVPDAELPWLLAVARNVRLNLHRGERRRRDREARCAEADEVPAFTGAVEAHSSLRQALQQLTERDREILLLVAWEGLDRAALATVLDCSKTAATVRLFRARRRLADVLAEADASPLSSLADTRGVFLDET